MTAIYNEIEPFAVEWLENLIAAGHVAPGRADARSIRDLNATDVRGPGQRHFFAGIAGWSLALRMAGVPDDADVWTGSCPCQPFSVAGRGAGVNDERHLWPVWFELIAECRPSIVFGEQVAGAAGRAWLAAVRADLEHAGYAVGAADLAAAGVGAPHIRQRTFFGAVRLSDCDGGRLDWIDALLQRRGHEQDRAETARCGIARWVADFDGSGLEGRQVHGGVGERVWSATERGGGRSVRVANGTGGRWREGRVQGHDGSIDGPRPADGGRMGDTDSEHAWRICRWPCPWSCAKFIPCRDGKARPTQPGIHPLAHGVPGRVGQLRAYGNAIVPQVAAEFVSAFLESVREVRAA